MYQYILLARADQTFLGLTPVINEGTTCFYSNEHLI